MNSSIIYLSVTYTTATYITVTYTKVDYSNASKIRQSVYQTECLLDGNRFNFQAPSRFKSTPAKERRREVDWSGGDLSTVKDGGAVVGLGGWTARLTGWP
jgi:hypothetical protein